MFKLKSFSVSLIINNDNSVNDKTKLINTFTGKEFWEDKDKVRHKYMLSNSVRSDNTQIPEVIHTYSEFEYRIRTLVGEHNCLDLLALDIFKPRLISRFFVHEFAKQLANSEHFEKIGHHDILSYDEWEEIFTSEDHMSKRYDCCLHSLRYIFMRHNRLAPKMWKYLSSISETTCCLCVIYLSHYILNPYLDSDDISADCFNDTIQPYLNWEFMTKNASIGKEFFIKYRHEFRSIKDTALCDHDYWTIMSESPNIDTEGFVKYVENVDPQIHCGGIWYNALFNIDLTNEGVIAYIEANPFNLTTFHLKNPTITYRLVKHIIRNVTVYGCTGSEHLQCHDYMTEEDLKCILKFKETHPSNFDIFDYGNMITNPNISDQFIEEQIFGILDRLSNIGELHVLYAHPRINEYFIEKYILVPGRMKSINVLRSLSQNPNFNESHLQTICTAVDGSVDNQLNYFNYFKYLNWVELIANPKISLDTLIKHATYLVDLKKAKPNI